MVISLGIESTAHTFGVGVIDESGKILANKRDTFIPEKKWGINPSLAQKHHLEVKNRILEEALKESNLSLDQIDIVSYSKGPGLPPCLKVGMEFAKTLKKPLIEVNHCVAHIEIAKLKTSAKDPIVIYVSGGNTQIIGYSAGKYRVFGETQDISIGNAIDTFIRATEGSYPGGPVIERLAKESNKYIELPYVVKGMDLSFTGIVTSALEKIKKGAKLEDVCFSFQETCYAMLTEVTERALAHTGKTEVVLTGGVAASKRLNEMLKIMCSERESVFKPCPIEFTGDNGLMIAWCGLLAFKSGQKPVKNPDFNSKWRTDEVDVLWIK